MIFSRLFSYFLPDKSRYNNTESKIKSTSRTQMSLTTKDFEQKHNEGTKVYSRFKGNPHSYDPK